MVVAQLQLPTRLPARTAHSLAKTYAFSRDSQSSSIPSKSPAVERATTRKVFNFVPNNVMLQADSPAAHHQSKKLLEPRELFFQTPECPQAGTAVREGSRP